jgi:hypothetical protein
MTHGQLLSDFGPATSLINTIVVANWGRDVFVECIYDPLGVARPYRLVFNECRQIRWSVIEDAENASEEPADLIGFLPGKHHYQQEALITTDQCEVAILYGRLDVQKAW